MKILVTGVAGFIGAALTRVFLDRGDEVVGVDDLNDYYDVNLKEGRLGVLNKLSNTMNKKFEFIKGNIANNQTINENLKHRSFDRVIHLAAQAGVRYSIENPNAYVESNLVGFTNILEFCRHNNIGHLTYASTSSVYGGNKKLPFSENDGVDHPLQFYAATKRANELMAHSYSNLFNLPTTGLRFFTVYGPWGRPDMALFIFAKKILLGEPIPVFNHGNHSRDFTFIDDIVNGIILASDDIPQADKRFDFSHPKPNQSSAPFRIFNIGNSKPVSLIEYIEALENSLGRPAKKDFKPLQAGDVEDTYADISSLSSELGYKPSTPIENGVQKFVDWYLDYYGISK